MKIPPVRILTQDITLLGQIDAYTSLLFNRKLRDSGDFQLVVSSKASGADKLAEGRLLVLGGDGHRAGIINKIVGVEQGANILYTVTGTTLNGLAARRITLPDNDAYNAGYDNVPKLTASGATPSPVPAETILKTYAARHMTSPADTKRKFPGLAIAPDLGRGNTGVWSSRLEQLNDVLYATGEYLDMGWCVYIDFANKQLVFDVLPGVDRSYSQAENSRVLFCSDYDNISGVSYTYDTSVLRNLGYAGGAGEDEGRIILKVTNDDTEPQGFDRREIFLDCGGLQITETDTSMSLSDEGMHQLEDYALAETLTATAEQVGTFIYLKNYNLGDLVTVKSKPLGVLLDTRITAVSERYEAGSIGIDLTFGSPSPDLGRIIRKLKNKAR